MTTPQPSFLAQAAVLETPTPAPLPAPPPPIVFDPASDPKEQALYLALTVSEREVACAVARGLDMREIALATGKALKTVDSQRLNALKKLEVGRGTGANTRMTRMLIRLGVVRP